MQNMYLLARQPWPPLCWGSGRPGLGCGSAVRRGRKGVTCNSRPVDKDKDSGFSGFSRTWNEIVQRTILCSSRYGNLVKPDQVSINQIVLSHLAADQCSGMNKWAERREVISCSNCCSILWLKQINEIVNSTGLLSLQNCDSLTQLINQLIFLFKG